MIILSKKNKFFADDGWAFWVDGDDTSTIYLNSWLNPKGKSYMDVSMHIRGIKETKSLNMYFPFAVDKSEIEDISLNFKDENLVSNEGKCQWFHLDDTAPLEMPLTAKYVMEHYRQVGRFTDALYVGAACPDDMEFHELMES